MRPASSPNSVVRSRTRYGRRSSDPVASIIVWKLVEMFGSYHRNGAPAVHQLVLSDIGQRASAAGIRCWGDVRDDRRRGGINRHRDWLRVLWHAPCFVARR